MQSNLDYVLLIAATAALAIATVSIHAICLWFIRRRITRHIRGKDYQHHIYAESLVISLIVVSLCFVHFLEITAWAIGYLAVGALPNFSDALYYSTTTYTTVGADGVSIAPAFRTAAGFESLLGPMMVAWSTAFLVEFVGRMRGPPPSS